MQDNIPDALIAAFERHYDCSWDTPALRNERLAWRAAWAEATKPCLHQIQEPAQGQAPPQTRFCPECGHVGEVGSGHRDCCPDGSAAFMVPEKHAQGLRAGFIARLSAAPAAVAVPEGREEFEEWATIEGYEGFERAMRGTGNYHSIQLEQLWQSWTNSRAALAATPAAAPRQFTDGTRTLRQDCMSAIRDFAGSKPEDGEDWESWFEAAFDLLGSRINTVFDEHSTPAAAEMVVDGGAGISKKSDETQQPCGLHRGGEVVLPEPVASVYTMEALVPGGAVKLHVELYKPLPAGTKLFAEPDVRALLAGVSAPAAPTLTEEALAEKIRSHGAYGGLAAHLMPFIAQHAAPQAQADARDALTPAACDVLAERARQISTEGYDPAHDDEHSDGSLSIAAACYALANVPGARPGALSPSYLAAWVGWEAGWFKPSSRRRNLEKACALLLADMERIDRAAIAAAKGNGQ